LELPFTSAIYYRCDAKWRTEPRIMPDEQLHMIHNGAVRYTIDGKTYEGRARQVVFCPPDVTWSARRTSTRLVNLTVIHFQARFPGGRRYLDALGFEPVLRPGRATWHTMATIGEQLCDLYTHKPDGHAIREAALMYEFFHAFYHLRGTPTAVDRDGQRVLAVIEYLRNHARQRITLDTLGRVAKVSPNHLATIFRRYTGQSPIDFLIHLRLNDACRLLRSSDMPIQRIADTVGYDDAAYFSRLFQRHMGLSPRGYRRGGAWT
jgi:AraC-like DNA-binding protein